jgi:thiol-disulfide isomerase/thioredoxin
MFNAMREVEIPEEVRNSSDSATIYYYYKKHYWDYLPLNDSSLLRTPLLARKVDEYMSKLVFIHPDSTITDISGLVEKARPSKEVVSWLCWHFLSVYQSPDYMGFDKVFIYLVDEYFSKEDLSNLTPSIRKNLQDRAEIMRPLLLGSEAPNLILIDSTGNYQSFLSLPNEYIVLFFWDIECGICKKEIVNLRELYADSKHDVEVFAISVNADLDNWKESLIEMDFPWVNVNGTRSVTKDFHDLYDISGTPAIFLLDKDRKIVAKHLSSDQIDGFLDNYTPGK